MRIEVIIPNYNGEDLLPDCLDSLYRQTRPPERVTVVDNGSTDRSGQIIRDHPMRSRLLPLPENRGFAAAVNLGIKESDADVVALLNNDMVCDPRWIEFGEKALQDKPQASMAASLILKSTDRDLADSAGDTYPPQARPAHIAHGKRAAAFEHDCLEVLSPCAGAAFYRKTMFDDTGCFEESFFAYLEDVDLGLRARSKGHLCLLTPRAVTYHAGPATLLADKSSKKPVDSSFRVRWIAENRVRVMARNLPASWLIIWS
ncbi:MAG: glycosyltransferase family 2 protein, partial [bacterium]